MKWGDVIEWKYKDMKSKRAHESILNRFIKRFIMSIELLSSLIQLNIYYDEDNIEIYVDDKEMMWPKEEIVSGFYCHFISLLVISVDSMKCG